MSTIIKDIEKNSKEIIRVDISEFKGQELINLRVWFSSFDDNGNLVYKPTQKGIAINISKYNELKEGIDKIGEYINDKKNGYKPEEL